MIYILASELYDMLPVHYFNLQDVDVKTSCGVNISSCGYVRDTFYEKRITCPSCAKIFYSKKKTPNIQDPYTKNSNNNRHVR